MISRAARVRAKTLWMPLCEAAFNRQLTPQEQRVIDEALHAPRCQQVLPLPPIGLQGEAESGFGSSPAIPLEGNSDPARCVDSGAEAN